MSSIPLDHLLKIGAAALQTTAQTLSGAINELKAALITVVESHKGLGTAADPKRQVFTINGTDKIIDGTVYMETSVHTTANGVDTFTFTNATYINANTKISIPYCDVALVSPVSIDVSGNILSIGFDSADNVGVVGVYIKEY